MTDIDIAYRGIYDSTWSTRHLVAWVLNWNGLSVAGDGYATKPPVWTYVSHSQKAARAFYASVEDRDELRRLAAEALAASGWTISAINYKKS